MTAILFICTGNIFRSVTAEYALRSALGADSSYLIGSAGIEAIPQPMHPLVRERLHEKGADPSPHRQRKLTPELLERTDLAVAIGLNHQDYVATHFGRHAPLFNEICWQQSVPVLDVHEALPNWESEGSIATDYMRSVIDHIWHAMPAFMRNLEYYFPAERASSESR